MAEQLRNNTQELPTIPDKLYFPISEASELCRLEQHVLRFWEQEFPQLKPAKRSGNRRYYQTQDILLLRRIKKLLYEEGYTIEGARTLLAKENSKNFKNPHHSHELVKLILHKLEDLLIDLETEEEKDWA